MKRIYLSGPMSGYPNDNKPIFALYAEYYRSLGFEVVNPHDIGDRLQTEMRCQPTYEQYLEADITEMLTCDTIILLPGWQHSPGARKEVQKGLSKGLKVHKAISHIDVTAESFSIEQIQP